VSSDAILHPSAALWGRVNVNFKPERWELGDKMHVGANKRGKSAHILLHLLHASPAAKQTLSPPETEDSCTDSIGFYKSK